MKIDPNTTVVDLAFSLYGSLTGIPAILDQLPVGERIGLRDPVIEYPWIPAPIGQSWCPNLSGEDIELKVERVYNPQGVEKAPYTTDLPHLANPILYMSSRLKSLYEHTGLMD